MFSSFGLASLVSWRAERPHTSEPLPEAGPPQLGRPKQAGQGRWLSRWPQPMRPVGTGVSSWRPCVRHTFGAPGLPGNTCYASCRVEAGLAQSSDGGHFPSAPEQHLLSLACRACFGSQVMLGLLWTGYLSGKCPACTEKATCSLWVPCCGCLTVVSGRGVGEAPWSTRWRLDSGLQTAELPHMCGSHSSVKVWTLPAAVPVQTGTELQEAECLGGGGHRCHSCGFGHQVNKNPSGSRAPWHTPEAGGLQVGGQP